MFADRGALELYFTVHDLHADQAEISSSSTNIANQDEVDVLQISLERPATRHNPGIKGREWLFKQCQFLKPGVARRFHSQLASLFVERGRHSQHYLLSLESQFVIALSHRMIPGVTRVSEITR